MGVSTSIGFAAHGHAIAILKESNVPYGVWLRLILICSGVGISSTNVATSPENLIVYGCSIHLYTAPSFRIKIPLKNRDCSVDVQMSQLLSDACKYPQKHSKSNVCADAGDADKTIARNRNLKKTFMLQIFIQKKCPPGMNGTGMGGQM